MYKLASRILALDTQPASLTPLVVRSNDSSGEMLTVGESPSSSAWVCHFNKSLMIRF